MKLRIEDALAATKAAVEEGIVSGLSLIHIQMCIRDREVKMEVEVGDKVIISKYSGTEVKVDNEEYTILRQSDILAIVE